MSTPVLKDLYGIGMSPLSIKNKKYAHEEELMANKEAGLLAIFQKDGSVISADYLLRCKRHLEKFTGKCINDGTLGSVYKISPDENLVQNIKTTTNLFTDKLVFNSVGESDFQFIRFDVDFDCFGKQTSAIFDPNNIRVQINFTHTMMEIPDPPDYIVPVNIDETTEVHTNIDGEDVTINLQELGASQSPILGSGAYVLIDHIDTPKVNPAKSYNIEESLLDLNRKAYAIDYEWYDGDTIANRITLNSFDIIVPDGFDPDSIGLVIHDILFAIK